MAKRGTRTPVRRRIPNVRRVRRGSPAAWLAESEALFRDFVRITPYKFKPFVKTFDTFDEYERWRRAQTNPWYR